MAGNLYVYIRIIQALDALSLWAKIVFSLCFWLSAIALFGSIALRDAAIPPVVHRTLFAIGSVWMVFILYMVIATLLSDIAVLIFPALRGRIWYALAITSLLLVYGYVNYRNPRVEQLSVTLATKHLEHPVRLVAISDVHLGYGTTRRDLRRYVELINEQQADVLVIVGDLIDNSITPVEREDMCAEFSRVHAPEGIYMVAGNHEYISGIENVERYLATTDVRMLRDSVVRLTSGIQLVCRDDRMNRCREELDSLISRADTTLPVVVLDHQPNDIGVSNKLTTVDLHISGHTHHGQVWPLNIITEAMYEQSYGYRRWEHLHAYVSSGLSLWGPPFRIGTQSEIVVVDIEPNNTCNPL